MNNGPFDPRGPTVLVGVTPVQVPTNDGTASIAYRIFNLTAAIARFTYMSGSVSTPTITVTAPVAGTSSNNTIAMLASSVEVFYLPSNCWFQASGAATFEITPGEGL